MSAILTQDLRSDAKDRRRVKAQKSKWAHGARPAAGTQCSHGPLFGDCHDCDKRPLGDYSRQYYAMRRRLYPRNHPMGNWVEEQDVDDAAQALHDSEGVNRAFIDSLHGGREDPEKDVIYSYDAATGPSRGSDILSIAITQAVERFENNETEKIVKNEYDLVTDGKDEHDLYISASDDDFELIDCSEMK